ncbi:MAG: bifunctional folylpolyglutamate synthase/dihydrofolate synthase, partial [Lachnospiraceae bacterium]|nr:bifunctional folylpolyglutamate synthase/dihydrofolate synthase [Lachnospiraceae bacterium]
MDFTMAMNYINEKAKLGQVPGLVNVKELLYRLDNPQNKCRCLHIAGTNGKGSIFAFVQEALIAEGYRVGRYISPTILDYRERFQINKKYISEEDFAHYLTLVAKEVESMVSEGLKSPTAFEIETAVGFLYFADNNLDY